jgi:hypothetical protein
MKLDAQVYDTQLKEDIKKAITQLADVALGLTRGALRLDAVSADQLDIANTIITCCELPGDMPLRVRLWPHSFMKLS